MKDENFFDPLTKDENLCMAVDCMTISDHACKCRVSIDGVEVIQTIYFCHDHYLRQKALEYNMEMK